MLTVFAYNFLGLMLWDVEEVLNYRIFKISCNLDISSKCVGFYRRQFLLTYRPGSFNPSSLTHLIRMEFPTVINWTSLFSIIGLLGICCFFQILIIFSVRKQWRPWSDAAFCGV